jgi:predicted DNA-binding antitoxin AbrB/MazE fold protein
MSMTLEAVYEDGALRLARPLPLPNHAHVTVTIESADETIAALVKASGGPTEPEPPDAVEIVQRAIRRVRARQS